MGLAALQLLGLQGLGHELRRAESACKQMFGLVGLGDPGREPGLPDPRAGQGRPLPTDQGQGLRGQDLGFRIQGSGSRVGRMMPGRAAAAWLAGAGKLAAQPKMPANRCFGRSGLGPAAAERQQPSEPGWFWGAQASCAVHGWWKVPSVWSFPLPHVCGGGGGGSPCSQADAKQGRSQIRMEA